MKFNIILNTLYQILTLVTPLITAPYVSRVIGADGIGVFSFTSSIQTYFAMFAALGTASYGTREISMNRNDLVQRSKLFWEIKLLSFLTALVSLFFWGLWIYFNNQYQLIYVILTISILAVMVDVSWFYIGIEEFTYIVSQNAFFKILSILAIFLFVKTPEDLSVYIAIMVLSVLLSNLSMWVYLPRFLVKISIADLEITRHFKETLIYFIPTIATSIYTVLDKTLIGFYNINGLENGYYEQATKIINMCKTLVFTSVNTVLGSRIAYLFAENKFEEIKKRIEDSLDFILFMGIGMSCGIYGIADIFVPWFFGVGYDKVIQLLKLMAPIIVVIGISNCLGSQYYTPAGLRAVSAKFIIVGAFVNLIFNIFFIPWWGSSGAVVSSLIAEGVITILYLTFCGSFMSAGFIINHLWKRLCVGVVMSAVIGQIALLNMVTVYKLAIQVISGILIYIFLLLLMKDTLLIKTWNAAKNKILSL